MKTTTIKQRTITLEFDDRKVVFRRMTWKAATVFLKKLAAHVAAIGGNLTDILPKLAEVVTNANELATELVVNSSDLSAEDLNALDFAQGSAALAAAVELNLGDELKNSFADIATTVGALSAATKTNSGESSTPTS